MESKQSQFRAEETHYLQMQLLPGSAKVSAVAGAKSRRQLGTRSAGREKARIVSSSKAGAPDFCWAAPSMVQGGGGILRPSKSSQTSSVQHARGRSRSPRWWDRGAPRLKRGSPAPRLCQHPDIDPNPSHLQVRGTAPGLVGKSRSPFQPQPCTISTRFGLWDRSVPRMLSSPQIQCFLLVSPRRAEVGSRDAPPANSTGAAAALEAGQGALGTLLHGQTPHGAEGTAPGHGTAPPSTQAGQSEAGRTARPPEPLPPVEQKNAVFFPFFSFSFFFFSSCWQTRPANASLSCVGPAPRGTSHPAKG